MLEGKKRDGVTYLGVVLKPSNSYSVVHKYSPVPLEVLKEVCINLAFVRKLTYLLCVLGDTQNEYK